MVVFVVVSMLVLVLVLVFLLLVVVAAAVLMLQTMSNRLTKVCRGFLAHGKTRETLLVRPGVVI